MAQPNPSPSKLGGEVCRACALCCSGVIFDSVGVDVDEVAGLESLGLEIRTVPKEPRFQQPCGMLSGTLCSIYALRPRSCRGFRCTLLTQYSNGEITLDSALSTVATAKSLMTKLQPSLKEGESVMAATARWRSEQQNEVTTGVPIKRAERARFHLDMAVLNLFLDRHFRSAKGQVMVSEPLS